MLSSLLTQFRKQYPQGSLTSDLLTIHDGQYVVRVCVGVDNLILASGLGANTSLEIAEDIATTRALDRLNLSKTQPSSLPLPIGIDTFEAPGVAIPKPSRVLPNIETIAIAPAEHSNGGAPTLTHPELAPPSLSLVPPALDPGNALEQPTSQLPLAAIAAPTLPQAFTPSQEELPHTFDTPAREFVELGIEPAAVDLSDIIAQTDVELQRLGWGVNQGREFLEKTYSKRSRHDLTDDELLEFLLFLETQSPPGDP